MEYQTQEDARLSDLVRRLGEDAGQLIKNEITLAKLELRESVLTYVRGSAKLGVAAALGLFGAFSLIAFAIIGLGDWLDNYWLSALLVAVSLFGIAGVLARSALSAMKNNSLKPEATVQTLKDDQSWARREAQDLKRKLKAPRSGTDNPGRIHGL